MTYFLLLTAFTVSIDSLVCGFSLSFLGKKKLTLVAGIALTVYIMCLFTNYLALFFQDYITERAASLGGIILIGVGVYNLFKRDGETKLDGKNVLKQSLVTGFAVGLDGAAANLSLALMGINAFYVPVIIALMHGIMVFIGILLSEFPFLKKAEKLSFLPSVILIILGLYKLSGLIF